MKIPSILIKTPKGVAKTTHDSKEEAGPTEEQKDIEVSRSEEDNPPKRKRGPEILNKGGEQPLITSRTKTSPRKHVLKSFKDIRGRDRTSHDIRDLIKRMETKVPARKAEEKKKEDTNVTKSPESTKQERVKTPDRNLARER